jgi:uncharacterized membrane protein
MIDHILSKLQKLFDKPILVVVGITILGASLRFYHLGFKPLWYDEAIMYWVSHSGNLQNIIAQNASIDGSPPLFEILISLILKIGDSEAVLRSLSWSGGVVAIPAIYFLSRQFLERTPAYFSTLVAAIAPSQIEFSQQLREYSLTFLMATIILFFFCRQLRRPTWYYWTLMTLAMVLSIFLQYGLALIIIALNLIWAVEFVSDKENRKQLLLSWGISQFIVLCAVFVVYYFSLRHQFASTSTSNYLSDTYWSGTLSSFFKLAISNTKNIIDFTFPGYFFLFMACVGFIAILQKRISHVALMMFSIPLMLTFVAACARLYPYQGIRQDIFLTPMIYVLVGFGFGNLRNVIRQRWVVMLLLLFTIYTGFRSTLNYLQDTGLENIRPIITTLSDNFEIGDRIYVNSYAKPAFTYYYRSNIDSQIFGISSVENPNADYQEIDKLLSSNGRIWMVFSHSSIDEYTPLSTYVSEKRRIDLVANDNGSWLYLVH